MSARNGWGVKPYTYVLEANEISAVSNSDSVNLITIVIVLCLCGKFHAFCLISDAW